jgi:hypothetical protein
MRPQRRSFGWLLLFGVGMTAAAACTWLVDADPAQCRRDDDCARFAGTVCDGARRVCVAAQTNIGRGPDGGAPASGAVSAGDSGFSYCPPDGAAAAGQELPNACTNAACIPFDNKARLRNLAADGTLKPLPDAGSMVSP